MTRTQKSRFYATAAVLTLTLFCGGSVMAQSKIDIESNNKALVAKSFANWRAGTGSPFDLLHADATWTIAGHSVASKRYADRDSFIREVIAPFNARMRERLIPTVREIFADGERVIVLFDASSVAVDGQPYTYAWFLTLHSEKVTEVIAFFDSIAFNELWLRVAPKDTQEQARVSSRSF